MALSRPNNVLIEVDKDTRLQLKILSAKTGVTMQDLTNLAILHMVRIYEERPERFTEIVRK